MTHEEAVRLARMNTAMNYWPDKGEPCWEAIIAQMKRDIEYTVTGIARRQEALTILQQRKEE